MNYGRFKNIVSTVVALAHPAVIFWRGWPAALNELIAEPLYIGGIILMFACVGWIFMRGLFWIPEFWMPGALTVIGESRLQKGITRAARVAAIIFFVSALISTAGKGPLSELPFSILDGAMASWVIIAASAWLLVQGLGWVVRGFVEEQTQDAVSVPDKT
ncbi:MAG: hypothetical protein HUJ31_16175 [Pseudomonadales bacterium]|nr:hypothetical protein [Pseudomonadales bacterium]